MKSNITKLYVINILVGLVLWYPIEKLFMTSIGITPFGVGLTSAVLLSIVLIFDVPAGVLADRWKRKYVLIIAVLGLACSSIIMGSSNSLAEYLLGNVAYGVYMVCSFGTFQAIMYDSLAELKMQNKYDKYQGRAFALFMASLGIGSLLGGYLAAWVGYRAAFYVSAIPAIFAIVLIISLKEPQKRKVISDKQYFKHMVKGFKSLNISPLVFHLSFFAVIAGVLRNSQNEFAGLYYIALGLTAIPTGYANAAKWLASSFGQSFARRIGRNALRLIPLFIICFTLFTLIDSKFGLIFFYLAVILHAILQNQTEAEIQNHIGSDVRATSISALSFMTNAILVPIGLLFGWVASRYSTMKSYQLVALIGLVYLVFWAVKGRKHIAPIYSENKNAVILSPAQDPTLDK